MEDIKRMVTGRGFSEVFWERIQSDRRKGGKLTFRACYAQMELEYEAEYGEPRYPSYEAFRKARERLSRRR
jgi:hypothetical protein